MADRRVKVSKYCSIVATSTEIAKKYSVSSKDKDFDNIDMLNKALRASNLLSLVDGSRRKPNATNLNSSGYSAEAIVTTIESDGSSSYIIIAEDDCYKYYAESIMAFTFMTSMIKKDMHHLLVDAMKREDPVRMYQEIQKHFKGSKLHHVEAARRALEAHRLGLAIEQDLSRLMELIAVLEKAQETPMPESQKFGILRTIIAHEERPHVRAVYGMASYNKESFNATIKKIRKSGILYHWRRSRVVWRQASHHGPLIGYASSFKLENAADLTVRLQRRERNKTILQSRQVKEIILRAGLRKAILVTRNLRVKLIRETITRRAPMGCIIICH